MAVFFFSPNFYEQESIALMTTDLEECVDIHNRRWRDARHIREPATVGKRISNAEQEGKHTFSMNPIRVPLGEDTFAEPRCRTIIVMGLTHGRVSG